MDRQRTIFLVWKVYQRRVEALQSPFGASVVYLHYAWEERSAFYKVLSYICKFCKTLTVLSRNKPDLVYVQAPPVFAVFATWLYCRFRRIPYIVDAHNPMIYDAFWPKFPMAKAVMRGATSVLVHNGYVAELARDMKLPYLVLVDRPAEVNPRPSDTLPAILQGRSARRVVVPCSYGVDEPLFELQKATQLLPDVDFFITWYRDKLPNEITAGLGPNVVLTGFLPIHEFNQLLACADAILVLTTRDGTQPSGATEALSFERPLVVSDSPTIRDLFPKGTVHVANEAESIAAGIRTALQNGAALSAEMASFKADKFAHWDQQFQSLKVLLAGHARTH